MENITGLVCNSIAMTSESIESMPTFDFYRNKNVLVTGATGLLGKHVIEKLLFATQVRTIFILIRSRNGKMVSDRLADYKNDQIFKFRLKSEHLARIQAVEGDISLPELGIRAEDRNLLIEQVNIVIHSAATVRFDEPLSVAMNLNVVASIKMMDLASEMKHLLSFVYVGTAFSSCYTGVLDDETHEPLIDPHLVLKLMHEQDETTFNGLTADLIVDPHPNTYVFSKNISEFLVKEEACKRNLPVVIAKPGIIIGAMSEPIPGFTDSLSQLTNNLGYGIITGILRVMYGSPGIKLAHIPSDYVANSIIMLAAVRGLEPQENAQHPIKSYAILNTSGNYITTDEILKSVVEEGRSNPPLKSVREARYPTLVKNNRYINLIRMYHDFLFVRFLDFFLWMSGKKPIMRSVMKKAYAALDTGYVFMTNDWKIEATNLMHVFRSLNQREQKVYALEGMKELDLKQHYSRIIRCLRKYCLKETDETSEESRKQLQSVDLFYKAFISFLILILICIVLAANYYLS